MYYDAQNKLVFVMPAKTGTSSFSRVLTEIGLPRVSKDSHILPKDGLRLVPELNEYQWYGFFRDPLDRFLSTIRFAEQMGFFLSEQSTRNILNAVETENYEVVVSELKQLCIKQCEYLENAMLLDFKNYTAEILRVAKILGAKQVKIFEINQTVKTNNPPSQRVIDFVQAHYADDYRLAKERRLS